MKCYSRDHEIFNESLEDIIQYYVDNFLELNKEFSGEKTFEVLEGNSVSKSISDYVPRLGKDLEDQAYDDVGEIVDGWLSPEEKLELQEDFIHWLEEYATEKGIQPTFFGVENIREIKVRVSIDKDGGWRILDNE